MAIDRDLIGNLLLLAVCGVAAFILMRRAAPLIKNAKQANSLSDIVYRIFDTLDTQRQHNAMKFGSPRKTTVIVLVNTILMLGWLYLGTVSVNIFDSVLLYLVAGFVANWKLRILAVDDLAALGLLDRLWLRIFHAWFWPLYLWAAHKQRSS